MQAVHLQGKGVKMNKITKSPILSKNVKKVNLLTFPQALNEVIDGRKITKQEWDNAEYYGELKDGYLMLHKPDGKYYQWLINDGDLLGFDWLVIEN